MLSHNERIKLDLAGSEKGSVQDTTEVR